MTMIFPLCYAISNRITCTEACCPETGIHSIIQLPSKLSDRYTTFLKYKGVPTAQHRYYIKWLRYYLDFCHKYHFDKGSTESMPAFLGKLKEKNQAEKLRKEAHQAISIYKKMVLSSDKKNQRDLFQKKTSSKPNPSKTTHFIPIRVKYFNQIVCKDFQKNSQTKEPEIHAQFPAKQKSADWSSVFIELKNAIKLRHYSPRTLKTYSGWTRKFQAYLQSKDPQLVAVQDVKDFLTWLAVDHVVSASTQNLAFNALLFLFRNVFNQEFGKIDGIVRAKRKPYIPVVLSRKEVDRIIDFMKYPHKLIISLMYGCGLRISECLSLRVQNFNFDMKILTIHDGKGKKDRTIPIPEALSSDLKEQLEQVIALHNRDCQVGFDGVFLYGLLEKKYKNAARELIWQWFFPAKNLTLVAEIQERRRYHVHETSLQKALRKAVKKANIPKRVTSHTFRHSFASHLLQANYDIRTIQQLLGHSDVRTTMIYTHTVKSVTIKEVKSPLDF